MARDIEIIAADISCAQNILEVMACYIGEAMAKDSNVDRVNSEIMEDALRGVANYIGRLSDDLSEAAKENMKTAKKVG